MALGIATHAWSLGASRPILGIKCIYFEIHFFFFTCVIGSGEEEEGKREGSNFIKQKVKVPFDKGTFFFFFQVKFAFKPEQVQWVGCILGFLSEEPR